MGVHGGPDIVTDGLVFNMDAANKQSYIGSGTSIVDSIQNKSGTISGATFQTSNSGEIHLDGSDDSINFGNLSTANYADQSPFSINIWFHLDKSPTELSTSGYLYVLCGKYNSNTTAGYSFFLRGGSPANNGLNFRSTGTGGLSDTDSDSDLRSIITDGKHHNTTITYNSSREVNLYFDGTKVGTNTNLNSNHIHSNAGNDFRVGVYNSALSFDFEGEIGPINIYNKELSSQEVLRNYNALKGRFGL